VALVTLPNPSRAARLQVLEMTSAMLTGTAKAAGRNDKIASALENINKSRVIGGTIHTEANIINIV
jgi:hypothetical protein